MKAPARVGILPLIFFTAVATALFPPILILLVPAYAAVAIFVLLRRRPKKETFETWWDDNWRDFL